MTATVKAYKGFDANFRCRGFQFEVGQTYTHGGEVKPCKSGFHACRDPISVFEFYAPAGSRYAEVEMSGYMIDEGDKTACRVIRIVREMTLAEMISVTVTARIEADDKVKKASRDYGPASATGERGPASATGERGAASATGENGAASATGENGAASATGENGAASATGDYGPASATGHYGAAMSSGDRGRVQGAAGCALFLVHRAIDNAITHAWAGIAGRDGIKPMTWYRLGADGQPVEVTR